MCDFAFLSLNMRQLGRMIICNWMQAMSI